MSEVALAPGLYRLGSNIYAVIDADHGYAIGLSDEGKQFARRVADFAHAEQLSSAVLFERAQELYGAIDRARGADRQERADNPGLFDDVERLRKQWCDALSASDALVSLLGAQP